jgi:hypothetical protein
MKSSSALNSEILEHLKSNTIKQLCINHPRNIRLYNSNYSHYCPAYNIQNRMDAELLALALSNNKSLVRLIVYNSSVHLLEIADFFSIFYAGYTFIRNLYNIVDTFLNFFDTKLRRIEKSFRENLKQLPSSLEEIYFNQPFGVNIAINEIVAQALIRQHNPSLEKVATFGDFSRDFIKTLSTVMFKAPRLNSLTHYKSYDSIGSWDSFHLMNNTLSLMWPNPYDWSFILTNIERKNKILDEIKLYPWFISTFKENSLNYNALFYQKLPELHLTNVRPLFEAIYHEKLRKYSLRIVLDYVLKYPNFVNTLTLVPDKEYKPLSHSYLDMIINTLAKNPALQTLDLSGQNIGDCGFLRLANALKKNTHLRLLKLSNNSLTFGGLKAALKILETKKRGKLKIDLNNLDDQTIDYENSLIEFVTTNELKAFLKTLEAKSRKKIKNIHDLINSDRSIDMERELVRAGLPDYPLHQILSLLSSKNVEILLNNNHLPTGGKNTLDRFIEKYNPSENKLPPHLSLALAEMYYQLRDPKSVPYYVDFFTSSQNQLDNLSCHKFHLIHFATSLTTLNYWSRWTEEKHFKKRMMEYVDIITKGLKLHEIVLASDINSDHYWAKHNQIEIYESYRNSLFVKNPNDRDALDRANIAILHVKQENEREDHRWREKRTPYHYTKVNESDEELTGRTASSTFSQALSVNDYLAIFPYFYSYVSSYFPWNKVKKLTYSEELNLRDLFMDYLPAQKRNFEAQKKTRAACVPQLMDQFKFIQAMLNQTERRVLKILNEGRTTQSILDDIWNNYKKIREKIHDISLKNQELRRFEIKQTRAYIRNPSQRVAFITYDPVNNKLKQEIKNKNETLAQSDLKGITHANSSHSFSFWKLLSFSKNEDTVRQQDRKYLTK